LASIPTHRELVERAEELLDAGDHAAATWDEPFVLLTSRLADRQKGRSTRWFERLLNFASQRLVKGRGDRASQWIDSLLSRNVTRAAGLRAIALADNLDPKVAALAINKLADWRETHALYEYLRSPASCGSDPLVIAAIKARAAAHSRFRLRLVERRTRVKSEIDAHMEVELAAALLEERSRTKLESSAGWSIRPDAVPTKWLKPATKLEAGLFAYCHGEQSKDEAGRPLPWLVRVEAGEFTMGSERTEHGRRDNEGPWPNVSVGEFWIAREVTSNKQYQCFDSWKYAWWDYGGDGHARLTSWSEASLYCRALTRWAIDHPQLFQRDLTRGEDLHRRLKAGELVFRLPKESELEYVMRWTSAGPGTFRGAYGVNESDIEITESNLSDYAVFGLEAQEGCEPVGSKRPTTPGLLFDLHGNHWEWCLDVYEDEPLMTAADAVHARGPSDSHVQRGGGFWNESTRCRASSRGDLGPVLNETVHNAFRVVLAPPLSPLRSSPLTPLIEGGFESELDVF
jgi:formylglycine-generating enzyme required for sulfatase activity